MPRPDQSVSQPIILAMETSGMSGSIALLAGSRCIGEHSLHTRLTHSRRLLQGISGLMADTGIDWPEINALAISIGPGSFTGLRIGLATAKGLAFASGIPMIGVASLDGLAAQFRFLPMQLCPIFDARKQEVWSALYRCDNNGIPQRISEYLAIPPAALVERITEPTLFVGDGLDLYRDMITQQLGELARFAPETIYFPRAAAIGLLAVMMYNKGEFLDPATATPLYIRPSEAEVHFKEKTKKTGSNPEQTPSAP